MTENARRRSACDECRTRKLKCSGDHPVCERCMTEDISCQYSTQKVMGRPRKRKLKSNEVDGNNRLAAGPPFMFAIDHQEISSQSPVNSMLTSGLASGTDQLDMNQLDLSGLDFTSDPSLLAGQTASQTCICLSSMYLTSESLRSMQDFTFPSSLSCIREALNTAKTCIDCRYCPTMYLTATQNVQLLGTLLLCVAERYTQVLKNIDLDAHNATEANQQKTIRIGSPTTANLVQPTPIPNLVAELNPDEWKKLAKRVVKAEVHGTSVNGRDSLVSIIASLQARQERWHMGPPTEDCPNPELRHLSRENIQGPHICLLMVDQARKLIERFTFE